MRSVKFDDDVDDLLTSLRGEPDLGKTKSDVVRSLIRLRQESIAGPIKVPEQLRRMEAMLTQLVQWAEDDDNGGDDQPPAYKVE